MALRLGDLDAIYQEIAYLLDVSYLFMKEFNQPLAGFYRTSLNDINYYVDKHIDEIKKAKEDGVNTGQGDDEPAQSYDTSEINRMIKCPTQPQ